MNRYMEMVQKIRLDPKLGKGSCSHCDEAFTDEELCELLKEPDFLRVGVPFALRNVRAELLRLEKLWWEVEGVKVDW